MKLRSLLRHFPEIDCRGSKEIEVTGISSSSKTIVPGNLFIAKKGLTVDGTKYVEEAIASGASCIITDLYNPFLDPKVTQLITKNVAAIEPTLANIFYGMPSKHLFVVGVTGTSGKTTTTYMIRHLLQALVGPTGLIGTVEWIIGRQVYPSNMTTPDVVTCHKLLLDMSLAGCKACAMEVSSHALTQGRVEEIDYDVALFTNLSQDHLDYHKDMDDYACAKARLFSMLKKKDAVAILNADDPYSEVMRRHTLAKCMTYGIDNPSDVMAKEIILTEKGSSFVVTYQERAIAFSTPLIGKFNVYNLLGAISVALTKGFELEKILFALASFSSVPGRLEKVESSKGLHIYVDYSHKPDALDNVLRTLSAIKKGRLFCLFGCGGDRDKGKRSLMGAVAEKYCDEVIVTTDNPRSEDPIEIIKQILSGMKSTSSVLVEPDRKKAIEKAISRMKKEDILLIAGKGHETYQIFSNGQVDFDDRSVAKSFCD
jgi:UDP-N-acetylmuramoyl-L-alanyl-D-glutamate--2,6-diaminopimelate ligase